MVNNIPRRGFVGRLSEGLERLATSARLAGLAAEVGWRSGLVHRASTRAALAAMKQRFRGGFGLASVVRVHGASQPDVLALVDERARWTYAELDARVDRVAGELGRLGLGRGDRIVVALANRGEVIEAQAAATRLGGTAVLASWRSTPDELAYFVSHSGARALVVEASLADRALAALRKLDAKRTFVFTVGGEIPGTLNYDEVARRGAARPVEDRTEEGAVVVYTSGTTGKPKGAIRRFGREAHLAYLQVIAEFPVRADDRHLVVCPLYHSTAFAFANITLLLGGTVHVSPKFEPEAMLEVIAAERITTTAVVPTMLHRLLQLPAELRERHDVRSLRAVFSGGAPLPGPIARAVCETWGHVLYNFYGSTETGINTVATPDELLRSPGTIGHAVGGNAIRILDESGRDVPDGTTGELFVKNDMLVRYHDDDAATSASMRDGYFSVGDLAHCDAMGLYHIDGRKRDMILSGGVNVYPAEVEQVLASHPAISEVTVVGVPDDDLGERVRAFVVLRPGHEATQDDVVAYAKSRLSGAKVPRDVVFLDELPRNPTGKISKRDLRSHANRSG